MVTRLPGILGGVQVFRPLARSESGRRGQCCFPFNQPRPRHCGVRSTGTAGISQRGSRPWRAPTSGAAIWYGACSTTTPGSREVLQAQLPVRQIRSAAPNERPTKGSFATMELDLLGYAFYSSLRDLLEYRATERQTSRGVPKGSRYLELTGAEVAMSAEFFRGYLAGRLSSFEISFIRIMGLISALKPFCQLTAEGSQVTWWLERHEFANSAEDLRSFVADLECIYTDERLEEFKRRVADMDSTVIRGLPEGVAEDCRATPGSHAPAPGGAATGGGGICPGRIRHWTSDLPRRW